MNALRVLVVGERFADSFADNLARSLEDGGHAVSVVSPFTGPFARPGRVGARMRAEIPWLSGAAMRTQGHVVAAAEELRPDVMICVDYRLAWQVVRRITQLDITSAFWFPDGMGNLGRETHVLAGYDAIFLKDSIVATRYRDMLGLNAHFLAEACNPAWHTPPAGTSPGDDGPELVIAGNMYATRFVLAQGLLDAGVPVRIYGPPWARWLPSDERLRSAMTGVYVTREEKARVFRGATAVLNSLAPHEGDGSNCRLFEAAGCGAVVLTEWRERLPEHFDVPGEVRAYATFDELVAQACEIAQLDGDARARLGDAAAARAHRDHGYLARFDTMLEVLGRG